MEVNEPWITGGTSRQKAEAKLAARWVAETAARGRGWHRQRGGGGPVEKASWCYFWKSHTGDKAVWPDGLFVSAKICTVGFYSNSLNFVNLGVFDAKKQNALFFCKCARIIIFANLQIFGAKKQNAQNCRFASHMNGKLGLLRVDFNHSDCRFYCIFGKCSASTQFWRVQ